MNRRVVPVDPFEAALERLLAMEPEHETTDACEPDAEDKITEYSKIRGE